MSLFTNQSRKGKKYKFKLAPFSSLLLLLKLGLVLICRVVTAVILLAELGLSGVQTRFSHIRDFMRY